MPVYEFYCDICEQTTEVMQSYNAPNPECCGKPMKRGAGGLSFWRWKDDRQGSTPGARKYIKELTNKTRK